MLYIVCLELWLFVDSSAISIVVVFHYYWCIRKSKSSSIILTMALMSFYLSKSLHLHHYISTSAIYLQWYNDTMVQYLKVFSQRLVVLRYAIFPARTTPRYSRLHWLGKLWHLSCWSMSYYQWGCLYRSHSTDGGRWWWSCGVREGRLFKIQEHFLYTGLLLVSYFMGSGALDS